MDRISIISGVADRELDAIRRTVSMFDQAHDVDGLTTVLADHVARGTTAETLDLIGHSRRHGMLVLGHWVVDDSAQTAASFTQLLKPWLDRLGVLRIRMLGCSTAVTERGWGALRRISQAIGRDVFGTKRYVSKNDYGPEGFISDEALAGALGPKPVRPDTVGFLASAANPISIAAVELTAGPRLTNDQPLLPVNEAVAAEILSFVDGARSWVLPGLLAEPDVIVLWSQGNAIHRLEILLDQQVVRAYGAYPDDDHGRLYRVRDPGGLNRLLDRLLLPRSGTRDRTT